MNNWLLLQAHKRNPSRREIMICVARKFSRADCNKLKLVEIPEKRAEKIKAITVTAINNSSSENAAFAASPPWFDLLLSRINS